MKKLASVGFALLMIFAVFVPVVAANDGQKETKGYLYVDLACRSPQISGEFTATPVIVSAPFTNAARVDKGFVDVYVKKVGEPQTFQFLPQGQFDTQAEPGTYLLQMENANGGQPEYALVAIKAGFKETVVFLGHGISGITEDKKVVVTVTQATYGKTKVVIDQAYVPGVPAVTHTVHHAAIPAYDEFVDVGMFHGDYIKIFGNYHQVNHNCGRYDKVHHAEVPAFDEVVVDVPAVPAVPEVSHVEGTFVDVTTQVQAVVDNGVTSFKFRNDFNPGGIFGLDNTLLKQIADPAYGQVKDVTIKFTVDGGETQTINTQEYQNINLL